MSFQQPALLLGLLLIPLAALLYARAEVRGRRGREAFSQAALLPSVAPKRPGWRRHVPVVFYGLALAALIVALARPQATLAVGVEQATVMLVTDDSGSMRSTDVFPTRMDAARKAADRFLAKVPRQVKVGAVAFNDTPRLIQTPTTDRSAVSDALAALRPDKTTLAGPAIDLARTAAKPPGGGKAPPTAMILLSDGKSGGDPTSAVERAAKAGIRIYTVALGTPAGTVKTRLPNGKVRTTPVPPDPESLKQIAKATGGESFAVQSAGELDAVYSKLGSQLSQRPQEREVTAAAAGGALLLLLLGAGAGLRWFGRML
ncbi:MAG: VWA domain-containing protein [Solirubrobacterales bacterium]|nr:VWA domain-containing protein [Solirubrobacterales bacterium]